VKVNLTLHHDENFGMAQVEAMACGTPVIGTAWGGLKDNIVEGVTGYKVSTVPTPSGVMVSWWEAVNRIALLLQDRGARERFRESCVRHAAENFSQARYAELLEEILAASVAGRTRPAEPLAPTEFATEYWSVCDPQAESRAPYRRGPHSLEMYRALVTPFSEARPEHVPAGEALEPGQVLLLATPIQNGGSRFRLDHALYPFELDVPAERLAAFKAVLAVMREEPAITVGRLTGTRLEPTPEVLGALDWMLAHGVLLRSRPVEGWVDPAVVDGRMSEVLFNVQNVDRTLTDFLVY